MGAIIKKRVVIRGGGDLATGVAQKFFRAGFEVIILETPAPTAIRRSVSLCEAVYDGSKSVEDITAQRIDTLRGLDDCFGRGVIPLLIDPGGTLIQKLRPSAVIDAILAKRNLGTNREMADITIGLGPGFCAGADVDLVIETMRGHDLGRLILSGFARPDTGIPGEIGGKSGQRVLRAPSAGIIKHEKQIGDTVNEGDVVFTVNGMGVRAPFTGLLRGLLREGLDVHEGMKTADIDPRTDVDWRTISDKARCLGGAALEAYFYLLNKINAGGTDI